MADFENFAELQGKYNATLPTLSEGQASHHQLTGDGKLIVSIPDSVAVTGTFWPATQPVSGTVAVTQSTSPWVVSANGGSFAVTQGTDSPWSVDDNNGSLTIDFTGQYLDGATWNAGSTGLELLAVRKDATGALTGVADGEFSPLQVNSNGELKVAGTLSIGNLPGGGTDKDKCSDETGDGLISLSAGPDTIVSIPVPSGTLKIYAWDWSADRQCTFRLEVYDTGTPALVKIIRVGMNSGSQPTGSMTFGTPVEVTGGANIVVRVTAQRVAGTNGLAAAGINAELY